MRTLIKVILTQKKTIMKKVSLFVAAVTFAAFTMTSCKKSYHCECTAGGITAKGTSAKYSKKDADAAKKSCESGTNSAYGITCKWVQE